MGESSSPNTKGNATKALVFILSSVSPVRWKQVVAYFLPLIYTKVKIMAQLLLI
uniref:Putative LOC100209634 [Hydra vulgaris] n=1 Tax=Lepeophtheirus salmonis TaxID=72036 RepID=A0A0K2TKF3_LEPSM